MTIAIIQFIMTAVVIIAAGTFLSRFADQIAERTGFGRFLIGSILLQEHAGHDSKARRDEEVVGAKRWTNAQTARSE